MNGTKFKRVVNNVKYIKNFQIIKKLKRMNKLIIC